MFWLSMCIRFPEILHSFKTSKNTGYDPLTLSGVVGENGSMITTTELPLALTLYTPHHTPGGERILLTVAAGKHVSVNTLLGLPFIKGAKATVDFEAGTVRSPIFSHFGGWPLIYRRPAWTE